MTTAAEERRSDCKDTVLQQVDIPVESVESLINAGANVDCSCWDVDAIGSDVAVEIPQCTLNAISCRLDSCKLGLAPVVVSLQLVDVCRQSLGILICPIADVVLGETCHLDVRKVRVGEIWEWKGE